MKQLLFIIIFILPIICFGQRKYSIQRFSHKDISGDQSYGRMPKSQNAFILITDSIIQFSAKDASFIYKITKKVNDNYFKATDGLKEYIVRIDSFKVFNLKTNIIIEDGKNTDSFLSKDEIIK